MQTSIRLAFLGLALIVIAACSRTTPGGENLRALVQRFVDAANAREYDALDDLLTPLVGTTESLRLGPTG